MTPPSSSNGNFQKIMFWGLSSMFTVILALWGYQNAFSARAESKNDVLLQAATKLTTEHEVKINAIEKDISTIKSGIDNLNDKLDEFLIQRYGYIPKAPKIP